MKATGEAARTGSPGHPSRRRQRKPPAERREEILWAAVRLFAERGYQRTTTREIAREAGVSEGTIYRYYRNKADILFSFLEMRGMQPLSELLRDLEGADDREVLRSLFLERFQMAERHRQLQKVVIGEAFFNEELAAALAERLVFPLATRLEEYVAGRVARGAFRPVDPAVATRALVGFLHAFMIWGILFAGRGRTIAPGDLAEGFASIFLDGIRRNHGGPGHG